MAVVVVGAGMLFGRSVAALAATGALYASIVDQPAPLSVKWRIFLLDITAATAITLLASLAGGSPALLGPLIAVVSAGTALLSAYGRRALGLGVAAVLALLFGMAAPAASLELQVIRTAVFAAGGTAYAIVALILSALLDDRTRQLYLGEAMLAFARYIAAKAELYETNARARDALRALVEAHADLVERQQAARDMIFAGPRTPRRTRWIAALIALLDGFDTLLSSDADIEILRASDHRHLMRRLHALTRDLSGDVKQLALQLMTPSLVATLPDRAAQLQAIGEELARLARADERDTTEIAAFRSTWHKLGQTAGRLNRLAGVLAGRSEPLAVPGDLDLDRFMRIESASPSVLAAQMTRSSPVLRYAIRLTLAMTSGYLLTLVFPDYIHGGWVLLTTALIMRANYSITRRRRDDRVLGNLAGCVVTVVMVRFLPQDALTAAVIIAIGVSHAFATVNYRVTAFAACISALLQLHFLSPLSQPLLLERIVDTIIGAGLAWGFSYIFPSWEWRNVPRLIRGLVGADRDYAMQALTRAPSDQAIRLARKRAHDMAANLSMTVRRLVDEPNLDRRALVALNELLAANYLLASDLASMRVLFRMRDKELEPVPTEDLLALCRRNVAATFALGGDPDAPPLSRRGFAEAAKGTQAAMSLKRRLVHIERTAERVAGLAARALREVA